MGISTFLNFFKSLFVVLSAYIVLVHAANAQTRSWQDYKVKVSAKEQSLKSVLQQLEQQTRLSFSYDAGDIDANRLVTLSMSSDLLNVLNRIGDQLNVDFRQTTARNISVRRRAAQAKETRSITGTVYNKTDGSLLPGAIVRVKGTGRGFTTDGNGRFIYKLTEDNISKTILEFRFLGLKTQDVIVGAETSFAIYMEPDPTSMQEVVVTSNYTKEKRREDVVGSIAQINSVQLQIDRPIESVDKMLEGVIAGVYVETNTQLGKPVSVNIRGQGTLPAFSVTNTRTTSSQPLYVIDGIPVYEQQKSNDPQQFQNETFLNPLANINPDDVKSISVLKDATASALYGANAANGVIIITTKGGVKGKTRLNLSYDAGVATFMNQFKYLSGPDYYRLLRETYINDGRTEQEASQLAGSSTINTDWFGLTNRNATYQNANIDLSGGSNETAFRFSAGYLNQQSSAIGNDYKKLYMKLRVDHQVGERFKMNFSLSPTLTNKNDLSNYGAVILPPNVAAVNPDGTYPDILAVPNPLAIIAQNTDNAKGIELMGTANASYKLTNEIALSGTVGIDNYQNKQTVYQSALNASGRSRNGYLQIYDRNSLGWVSFLNATYDKTFAQKHTINALLGTQAQDRNTDLLRGIGTGFSYDQLRQLSNAATQSSASSKQSDATVSYYGQIGYDWDKKYYLNVNARIDRSSLFGGDKQSAFNNSIGGAWVISKEEFLKDNKFINFLKLRITYGKTGNSRIGTYASRGLYSFSTSGNYNGNAGSLPASSSAPNPYLGWERNYKFNLGLDVTFLQRFQLTAEYYRNTLKDLISSIAVPYETGFNTYQANTGTARNEGFELSLNSQNINTANFKWSTVFNFGFNRNKILAFNNGLESLYSFSTDAAAMRVGLSTSAIWGYRWAGVNPQTGAEQFYDNKGNILTPAQVRALPISEGRVLGDRLPDFQGGFINNFNYKDLTLTVNLLYSYGANIMFRYIEEADGLNLANRNQSVNLLNRWKRAGDITNIPRLSASTPYIANSSRYLHDASYIKLSNVSLNYQLPKALTTKLGVERIAFFANATNLFYIYKERGTENRNGVAEYRFTYPETRAFTGGIKLGL